MTFREIRHGSDDYRAEVALRFDVLRRQLAPGAADDNYDAEAGGLHFGLFDGPAESQLVACCFVVPLGNGRGRLRQMAVAADLRRRGLGRELMTRVEAELTARRYSRIVLHAREVAMGFYEKSGYHFTSDEFMEVGIPHFRMEKALASGAAQTTSRYRTG